MAVFYLAIFILKNSLDRRQYMFLVQLWKQQFLPHRGYIEAVPLNFDRTPHHTINRMFDQMMLGDVPEGGLTVSYSAHSDNPKAHVTAIRGSPQST